MKNEYPNERGSSAEFSRAATGMQVYISCARRANKVFPLRERTIKNIAIFNNASKNGDMNPCIRNRVFFEKKESNIRNNGG